MTVAANISAPRAVYPDLIKGLGNSRILRAVVVTAAVIATLSLLVHPAAWLIAAVAVSTFVLSSWLCKPGSFLKAAQQVLFECSALKRLIVGQPSHQIEGTEIFLGPLPNRLSSQWEKESATAVLSLNEPWERSPLGLSLPYTAADWQRLGVAYKEIDQRDYRPLSMEILHESADWIHEQLSQNRKVFVHCRAGKGRSANGIAAYLMKYQKMSASEARQLIKNSRPSSTVKKAKYTSTLEEFGRAIGKSS